MQHKKFDREILKQIKPLYVYDNWHAPIGYAKSNIEISRNRFSHFMEHFFYWNARRKLPPYSSFISCYSILELKKAHHILMQDDEYCSINERFGGIFISNNKNPSMWQQLWRRGYV